LTGEDKGGGDTPSPISYLNGHAVPLTEGYCDLFALAKRSIKSPRPAGTPLQKGGKAVPLIKGDTGGSGLMIKGHPEGWP